jgi:tRNA threonylcarbamoyladenosine biosynthesis protein TsaB
MRSQSKVLLAIDTSTRTVGLAFYDGSSVLNESVWTSNDYHTVELAPAIESAMQKSNITAEQLGALAVAIGPGSFTGLRIGLALAKGLAMVRQLPIIGIPTLDALAIAQPLMDIPMAAVLRAGRGRLAISWYKANGSKWQSTNQMEIRTPTELAESISEKTYICGELTEKEQELFRSKSPEVILATAARSLRRPAFLAELAWARWQSGETDDPASLSPTYLHYNDPIPG